jgi:hypothetical protein
MTSFDVDVERLTGQAITDALRDLLENKHLYQSVTVSCVSLDNFKAKMVAEAMLEALTAIGPVHFDPKRRTEEEYDASVRKALGAEWLPLESPDLAQLAQPQSAIKPITFRLPTVHTFCTRCKKLWPFNPNPQQGFSTILPQSMFFLPIQKWQVFVFAYQCQSCKGEPLVFEVRRQREKLTLCGRSIIESVPVPKVLPTSVANFYADAKIAHNSGQTLAGLFLLRTFIEQFWRKLAERGAIAVSNENSRLYADDLGAAYNTTLPDDFKSRFPSLSKIYEEISARLHDGSADADLFAEALDEIKQHFEARRLFRLDGEDERRASQSNVSKEENRSEESEIVK